MTLTKSIIFIAIFTNINCIWQRRTHFSTTFRDLILLDLLLPQHPMDITETKSEAQEYKEKKEDSRIRLLRKRYSKAMWGKIRIL